VALLFLAGKIRYKLYRDLRFMFYVMLFIR
jgi:hypothetical protein